jgi:hypothetical protein
MRSAIRLLAAGLLLSFSGFAEDTCQMGASQVGGQWFFACDGSCDNGDCDSVTGFGGGVSIKQCFCGGSPTGIECAGRVINDHGNLTLDCDPNGCDTCVTPWEFTEEPQPICFCY